MTTQIRTFSELSKLTTFEERFEYLRLKGEIGVATFGFDRYLNETFYKSYAWKKVRNYVLVRDQACDLSVKGFTIFTKPVIHHMNPLRPIDLMFFNEDSIDPDFLITVSFKTHMAIHYGSKRIEVNLPVERRPSDTCPWKQTRKE